MSAEKGRNGASDERGGKSRVNSDVASENSIINSRDLKSDLYADGKWRAWSTGLSVEAMYVRPIHDDHRTVFGAWLIQLCAVGVVSQSKILSAGAVFLMYVPCQGIFIWRVPGSIHYVRVANGYDSNKLDRKYADLPRIFHRATGRRVVSDFSVI